jgi:4-hydroxybutyrate dehydrogenase
MRSISYPTRIEFGEGESRRIPECLEQFGSRRPLIATDRGLRASGVV